MGHLRSLGGNMSFSLPRDEDGFTGRECPEPACEGYFKIELGTGLKGKGLPCHCAYCGHSAGHDQFHTKEQIKYAKSLAMRKITDAIHRDLKGLEFNHKPMGAFGIGLSLKVKRGQPVPIHRYREEQLETEVVCAGCTLRYSVYGVFAFCPDCGRHNSLQILEKNFELIGKMLDIARGTGSEVAEKLTENALEDCVSAFDGFGRELCRVYANAARNPAKVVKTSFQNLDGARSTVADQFGVDLSAFVTPDEWQAATQGFQQRHVVAHKMGVVDDEYIEKTGDKNAIVGRKIVVNADEVRLLTQIMSSLAARLAAALQDLEKNDTHE